MTMNQKLDGEEQHVWLVKKLSIASCLQILRIMISKRLVVLKANEKSKRLRHLQLNKGKKTKRTKENLISNVLQRLQKKQDNRSLQDCGHTNSDSSNSKGGSRSS